MPPKNYRFGGGVADTVVNPAVLLVVVIAGVLMFAWPRKRALPLFLLVSILTPMDQILVIGGLHFQMLRVLVLFGIARLVKEKSLGRNVFAGGINKIDWAVILLTICIAINEVVLFWKVGAAIFQLGNIYTVFGIYFWLRYLVRNEQDILRMIRTLVYVASIVAIIMTYERVTGHNPYALLGGANAAVYAILGTRANHFRAAGCFDGPIVAGTFGAVLIPLFVMLWHSSKRNHAAAVVGIIAGSMITLASNSTTPVLAYAAGVVALCMWPIRNQMQVIRWGIVVAVASLHLVMKAPVWHLIARIDVAGGSSSYQRFELINQCIRHFGDWWFVGVKSTYEWGFDMWDTANQYVSICDSSGLLPFILFLAVIVYGFKFVGKARKVARDRRGRLLFWSLGAALFANVVAFVGITYGDQIQVVWYGLLAAISAAVLTIPKTVSTVVRPRVRPEVDYSTAEGPGGGTAFGLLRP